MPPSVIRMSSLYPTKPKPRRPLSTLPSQFGGSMIVNANAGKSGCSACGH